MQCIITEKQLNQIINIDETKIRDHDLQIDRAKENLKFSYGGPSVQQALGTIQQIKVLCQGHQ